MDRDRVAILAEQAGSSDIAHALADLALPSLRLVATEGRPSTGATRLGGTPDLPAATPWPRTRVEDGAELALTFVAQLRLDDVDTDVWPAPRTGLLSFFALADPETRLVVDGVVVHTPPDVETRATPAPGRPERSGSSAPAGRGTEAGAHIATHQRLAGARSRNARLRRARPVRRRGQRIRLSRIDRPARRRAGIRCGRMAGRCGASAARLAAARPGRCPARAGP